MIIMSTGCGQDKLIQDKWIDKPEHDISNKINTTEKTTDNTNSDVPLANERIAITKPNFAPNAHPQLENAIPIVYENDFSNNLQLRDLTANQGASQPTFTYNNDDDDGNLCGNAKLDHEEQCDDGNSDNDDNCNNNCQINLPNCSTHTFADNYYIYCLTNDDFKTNDNSKLNNGINWDDARSSCKDFGPFDLVTINSASENTFLTSIINDSAWIGLNTKEYSCNENYVWSSGQSPVYTNWDNGEPNLPGEEDCTEIYNDTGKWNNLHCNDYLYSYICQAY